jgi:parvulin-like peptidyl-prolyl isomerase
MARRPALFLALAAALVLAACGDQPASPPPGGGAAPGAAGAPPADGKMTVTHFLIAFKSAQYMPQAKRTKEQAREVAKSLLQDAVGGRPFEEIVEKFTDDKDQKTGKPNTNNGKPGSYTFPPPQMMPAFDKAARDTPVGKIAPEPVETPYGFHVIRRDK